MSRDNEPHKANEKGLGARLIPFLIFKETMKPIRL